MGQGIDIDAWPLSRYTRMTVQQVDSQRVMPLRAGRSWSALAWAASAFSAGILLNVDRVPPWVPLTAFICIAWRWMADTRSVRLPGTAFRTVLAAVLVAAVLARFRTLNGLNAGTALLVLMGSVKLLETRAQRDQYIVIGAAFFLLLAACLDRQDLWRAPLYLLHVWVCCAALAVVAYAPHPSAGSGMGHFSSREALTLTGRTLAFALPLGLCLFLFFPRLPGAFWAIPRADEALTGLGESMSPGSIARLTSSYDIAFRARFDGAPPPPQERYWRGPVLHDFDGFTWRRPPGGALPRQPLEYLGTGYRYHVALEPNSQRWWFSLDTATAAPAAGVFLTYDYQLISAEPVTTPVSYTLVSHTNTRASGALPVPERRHDSALPPDLNPRSRQLALQIRANATSDTAFAAAVLEFLRTGGFEYSLTPPRLGRDSVDDFLFRTRSGFCGHYASAFVSLMRAGSVPARVVTGYLGGEWNPIGGYFIVRQSDAHSWAEVWLDGRGWTRIDPTGVVEPERLRRGILDLLPNAVSAPARFVWSTPWLVAVLQRWDAANAWWNDRVVKFDYEDQLRILQRLGVRAPGVRELGWAFAGGLIGWLLWISRQVGAIPRPRRPDQLARAYDRLRRKLARAGVARNVYQGPLAIADEVTRRRPDLAEHIGNLVMRYARLRYGTVEEKRTAGDVVGFERDVRRLRIGKPL